MSAYIRAMRILGGGLRGACNVNSSCDVRLTPLAAAMSPLRWRERRLRDSTTGGDVYRSHAVRSRSS